MTHAKSTRRTIGLLTPYMGGVFCGTIIASAAREARRQGARLVVVQLSPRDVYQSRLAWNLVDGWVVVKDSDGVDLIAQAGVPVVTISCVVPGLPAVLPDNRGGMHAAVSHLIDHGHRRIVFIGRLENTDVRQRFEGYKAALIDRDIAFDERLVFDIYNEMETGGSVAARELVKSGLSYTAIAGSTDKNAIGAADILREAGYRIPEDLAIVGFDDLTQAQANDPPLTTIRLSFESLASTATAHLLAQLSGRAADPGPIYIPTALITRRSCGCEQAQSLSIGALAPLAGTEDWRTALARGSIQIIAHPFMPDPTKTPAQVWPGLETLIRAIDGAIAGHDLPSAAEIEAAWQEALILTADVDTFSKVFNLIEQVSMREFAALNDEPTRARLTEMLQLIRGELLRASVAHGTMKVGYLDTILHTNNEISTNILSNVNADAPKLDWLRHTPAQWGCLGLWTDPDRLNELTLVSLYVSHVQAQSSSGDRVASAAFPPLDMLRALVREESDIITLLPLHTSRRNWGVLAMDGLINTSVTWNSDPIVMWSRMLGAALDRAALLTELNQQQEELRQQRENLQVAYDRERALATTIRELGCPVIPLMPGVILIPLIGGIDSERAQQIIKLGLEAVGRERATDVLIDVTGVPLVDTQVAGALIQMARMLALLGARTMLVGIRPEIAQSIVGLGIDLARIIACSSLAEAIRLLRVRGAVKRET